jgi:hypothetical protein
MPATSRKRGIPVSAQKAVINSRFAQYFHDNNLVDGARLARPDHVSVEPGGACSASNPGQCTMFNRYIR